MRAQLKKSHSITLLLVIILSFYLVPQTSSPTTYEYMFKSYLQYKLDDYNTYIKFALDLYVDKIIWRGDKFEVVNAKMGGGTVSNAWFKITRGNLTVLTFFENYLLKLQLDGSNGEHGNLEFHVDKWYEPYKIYTNGRELTNGLDWSYNYSQNSVIIQITYESSLVIEVHWTEGSTYNGITLSKSGNIVTATSPYKYKFTIGIGGGTARHWNLSRLDSTKEMVFKKIHYWFRVNDTGQTSSQSAFLTTSNSTFTDSLGSGIKFNMTFSKVWVGSQPEYGFTVYQIFWFYRDFIIEELILKNDYNNAIRRLQTPSFVVYSGYKNFRVGPGETTRFIGMGTEGYDKLVSTEGFATRPPFFAYNTAENKGVVVGFLKNTWDWVVRKQYYNETEDPSIAITVDTVDEYIDEYIDIPYGQTYQLGKMFIELTGRQVDTSFADLGKVYETLYPGRPQLSGYNVVWSSWSAYGDNVFESNITQAVDYIATNLKDSCNLNTIVVDNGYQADVGNWTQVRANWGNHDLQWMASYITSKGLNAGIWVAPWLIGPYALNNATMKSWLLNDTLTGNFKNVSLAIGSTYYVLNPTISEARNFVANQLNTLEQWGFSYFKLDFIQAVMDAKQMHGSGNTRATWIEWAFNISAVIDNDHYVSQLGVQSFGTMQPYLAQQYANSVRFSTDLTDMAWKNTLDAYYAYHTAAPIFNYLTVDLDRDMLGDSAKFADSPWTKISDNHYKFHLTFLGITKVFQASENYDTANQTKLTWVKKFLPFRRANWTQRDYWEHAGIPRTWLTSTTLMNNTYYYLAVFNPTDNEEVNTISFSTNLNLSSGTYLIYDNYADSYLGTNSSSLTVTLGARDARIFTLLKQPSTPVFFAWDEKDHISTSQITSATWANNKLTYTISAPFGTTSTNRVYAGEKGEPAKVLIENIEKPINYNSSAKILTITAAHSSKLAEIVVDWNPYPPNASFLYSPLNPYVNDIVIFNASDSRPNGGYVDSYQWNLDDDFLGQGVIVTHMFETAGTYKVTLNVTDSEGLWNSVTTTVKVSMPPPPSIWKVEHSPELPEYHETVIITANITSQESDIDMVILNYSDGSGWTNITMTIENELYVATIPVLPYGTTVQYKVYASNDLGNWTETNTFSYTVTDTIPPDVGPVQWNPENPSAGEEVVVSTQVGEPAFASGVKNVTLLWRVYGEEIQSSTMTIEDAVWKATIPAQNGDTSVYFVIESCDYAGNCAESQWYTYGVKGAGAGLPLFVLATIAATVTVLIGATIYVVRRRQARDKVIDVAIFHTC